MAKAALRKVAFSGKEVSANNIVGPHGETAKKIEKRTNCAKNAQVLSHKTKTTTARCRRTKNMRAMNMLLTHLLTSLLTY